MNELVECHSGYAYPERPIALYWEGQRLEIAVVEAQWHIPEGNRFRVRTKDNRVFELIYEELNNNWKINPQ